MKCLSFSKIRTFLQCPLRFQFEYVEARAPEFVSADFLFGQAIHQTLAEYGLTFMSGESLSSERFGFQFLNDWHDLLKQHPQVLFGQNDAAGLEAKGMVLMDLFLQGYLPGQILGVEEPFELELEAVPFQGRFDWLEENAEGEMVLVVFKTASRKPTFSASALLKPSLYALALAQLGWSAPGFKIRLVTLIKTQKPQLEIQEFIPQASHLAMARQILTGVYSAIQSGVVYPNPSYYCQTCPYKQSCKTSLQKTSIQEVHADVYSKVA